MARQIRYFFQNGFATEIDGRCYLRKKVPGGFAAQEVTGGDGVINWFTVASCDSDNILANAQRWGLGGLSMPGIGNGWTVERHVGQCTTQGGQTMLIRNEMYAQPFIAINVAGIWKAGEADGTMTDEQLCGAFQQLGKPTIGSTFTPFTGRYDTPIIDNIDWRIVAAIAIITLTGLYALYLTRK